MDIFSKIGRLPKLFSSISGNFDASSLARLLALSCIHNNSVENHKTWFTQGFLKCGNSLKTLFTLTEVAVFEAVQTENEDVISEARNLLKVL